MGRFDVIIAGGGPTGMLAALLAKADGLEPLVVEARPRTAMRDQLIRIGPDTIGLLRKAGVGNDLLGPATRPGSRIVAIRAIEQALRGAATTAGVDVRYQSTLAGVRELDSAGVRATVIPSSATHAQLHDEVVEAPVLLDATGGRLGIESALGLDLQDATGYETGIALRWSGAPPVVPANPEGTIRHAVALGDGSSGTFIGMHDPDHGTFGVLEVPDTVPADRHPQLVTMLERGLGLHGRRSREPSSFEVRNAGVRSARAGSVVVLGDAAGRTNPRDGRGLRAGAGDAADAVRALTNIRYGQTSEGAAWGAKYSRERQLDLLAEQVMARHRENLRATLAPSPFRD